MKRYFVILIVFLGLGLGCGGNCYGLTITKPPTGSVFHSGDKVLVNVEPSANESLQGVFIFTGKLGYSTIDMFAPYELEFVVDHDFVGTDKIVASGKMVDGKTVETEVEFKVVLPDSVRLVSLSVWPTTLILYKLPESVIDARRKQVFETEDLSVGGVFSDGYKRSVTSASSGTTYQSSDEGIVTVDSEGLAMAKKAGRAKIVITNNGKEISVNVIVKEKDH